MSNPFQIGEEADLSFGDEDFLLDSIDLEAIAAKALQAKPSKDNTNNSIPNSNSLQRTPQPNTQQQNTTRAVNSPGKQFQPFSGGGSGVNANNENNSSIPNSNSLQRTLQQNTLQQRNLTTPQNKSKKFVFKPKKSPEGANTTRPALSPLQNSPTCSESSSSFNQSVSPVLGITPNAVSTNRRDGFHAHNPGGATSKGLRTPNCVTIQIAQPPMAVTVKRDGSSITKIAQPNLNPQIGQKLSSVNAGLATEGQHFRVSSLRQLNNLNPNMSVSQQNSQVGQKLSSFNSVMTPPEGQDFHVSNQTNSASQNYQAARVFQKFVPSENPSNTQSLRLPSLSQASGMSTQLRNPSMNLSTSNPSQTLITGVNHEVSGPGSSGITSTSLTSLRTNTLSNPSNEPQTFVRNQPNTVTSPNLSANSQNRNQTIHSTPRPTTQFQDRSGSPVQASTPGYRTPSGGPSPGSSRSYGGNTPMQQSGQASRYPATPESSRSYGGNTPMQQPGQASRYPAIPGPSPGSSKSYGGTTPIQQLGQTSRYPTTPRTGGSTFSMTGGTPQLRGGVNRPGNPQQHVPLLTPRVAQLCQTPSGNGSTMRTRARKFPGPAGVLPKLKPGQKLDDAPAEDVPLTKKVKKPEPSLDDSINTVSSQDAAIDEFQRGAWLSMKTELGISAHSILTSYNIAIVLRKASLKQLPRKQVPNLCVMIRNVTHSGSDACVLLKDPSGEMHGTVHRKIVEDYSLDLKPGCILVLRKVGVLSPSIRNHYLNITPSNLVQVYPVETGSTQCSQSSPSRSQEIQKQINRSPDNNVTTTPNNINKDVSNQLISTNKPSITSNNNHMNSPTDPPTGQVLSVGNNGEKTRSKTLLIEGVNTPVKNLMTSSHDLTGGNNGEKTRTKTLLIEGVNTPVRNRRKSPQSSSIDLANRGQQTNISSNKSIDVQQLNKPLPQSGDRGINLDQSSGGSSMHGEEIKPVKNDADHKKKCINNNLSWLRKRQIAQESDQIETVTKDCISEELPSKRQCLDTTHSSRGITPNEIATEPARSVASSVNSNQVVQAAVENFEMLLDGIGDDFFDDF